MILLNGLKSGNLGNQWNTEYLDLSSYSDTINIKFENLCMETVIRAICVDQIEIYSNLTEGCTDTLAINYDSNAALVTIVLVFIFVIFLQVYNYNRPLMFKAHLDRMG